MGSVMQTVRLIHWSAALLLAGAVAASAQVPADGGDRTELERLIAEATEGNADVVEARALADAVRQRVRPAAALPDPMLSIGYENDGVQPSLGTESMTRLQLMAQQGFPFPGKRALAGRIAAAEADEVGTRPARARLGVEAAVRRAYADILLSRVNLGVVKEQIDTWAEIEEVTRSRYSAGMGSQQDVLRAQSESTRLMQQRVRDEAAEETARAELARVLQRPVAAAEIGGARFVPPPRGDEPLSREEAHRLAEEVSPELKEVILVKERARLGVDLARRNRRPDFVASASYMNRGGLPLMWSVGLGASVPLWAGQKQAPLIAEAESRVRAASAAEISLRALLKARTEERLIRLRQLAREAALDTDGILVQDQLSVDSALASYRTGAVPFVTVLEALSTLFGDRRSAASRLAGYMKAEADLREFSLEGPGPLAMTSAPNPGTSPSTKSM
jgi:outer membrane protein, heavy metal efflux system